MMFVTFEYTIKRIPMSAPIKADVLFSTVFICMYLEKYIITIQFLFFSGL